MFALATARLTSSCCWRERSAMAQSLGRAAIISAAPLAAGACAASGGRTEASCRRLHVSLELLSVCAMFVLGKGNHLMATLCSRHLPGLPLPWAVENRNTMEPKASDERVVRQVLE
jgi:hypothetical protein